MKGRFSIGERVTGVGFPDSLWLTVALILAALPLISGIGLITVACFCTANLLHLRGVRVGVVVPTPVRWLLLVLGFAGVYFVHGSFVGMEPGIAVFVTLYAVKILEMRTRREYQVICGLGYFLLLCTLFLSQELLVSLYSALVFLLVTATLLRFHSVGLIPAERRSVRLAGLAVPLRTALLTLLMALPVVVILFFFFPRPSAFGLQLFRKQTTGMSDHLAPGVVEEIVADGSLAFRVRFLERDPRMRPYYWRGAVLTQCDGLEWTRGSFRRRSPPAAPIEAMRRAIKQEIVVEPYGGHWLFALDQPLSAPEDAELRDGYYLLTNKSRPVDQRLLYQVFSGKLPNEKISEETRADTLKVPEREGRVSPRLLELANSWQGTPREKMIAAQRHFSSGGFTYTLSSGSYRGNGWQMLDEFMFSRKRGFCSHYAAAFSSLMRLCGVPARAVVGYAGGEYNPIGGFYSVYQSDAHAWSEVWLEGEGWVRVDPTNFVPGGMRPERNVSEEANPAEEAAESDEFASGVRQTRFLRSLGYQWAALNYRWTLWILGYDHDVQREFLNSLGLRKVGRFAIFLGALGAVAVFLAALGAFLRFRGRRRHDPLTRAYERLCRKLARVGPVRAPAEPPTVYLERVLAAKPELGSALKPLFADYLLLQYAPWKLGDAAGTLRRFRKGVKELSW